MQDLRRELDNDSTRNGGVDEEYSWCRTRGGSWTTIAYESAEFTRTTRVQDSRRDLDNDSIRIGGVYEDDLCARLEEGVVGQRYHKKPQSSRGLLVCRTTILA